LTFVGTVAAVFTPLDEGVDPISIFDAAEARPSRTAVYQLLGIHYEVLELARWGTFGIGVMIAYFHCCGTVNVLSDWLNSWAMGAAKAGHRGVNTMQVNHQVLLPLVEDDPRS